MHSSNPTHKVVEQNKPDDSDDATVVVSNTSKRKNSANTMSQVTNKIMIAPNQAIADTGATSIFIMEGTDIANRRVASSPLTINLPDGMQVRSVAAKFEYP